MLFSIYIFLQLCLNTFKDEFIEIATKLSAVIACRCSPTQKADVARLIRKHTRKRVCCIGDGGNDVSMIQAADVGEDPRSLRTLTPHSHNIRFRRRYCWKGGQASILGCRFLCDTVQLSHEAPHVAWSQLLSSFCQPGSIRHSSRSHHLRNASRILSHLLLRAYSSLPRMANGGLRHYLYDGTSVFSGA